MRAQVMERELPFVGAYLKGEVSAAEAWEGRMSGAAHVSVGDMSRPAAVAGTHCGEALLILVTGLTLPRIMSAAN
jgi:hypothetical protein